LCWFTFIKKSEQVFWEWCPIDTFAGRHSKQEIERMAIDDITAISTFLADKQYFMGSKLTTIDATVWGEFLYPSDS
jgi:hypothetical protein